MATSNKDIIKALRRGSDGAFRLLTGKYMEAVYWHIRRLVVSHADAQDATQEAFIRMFRYSDRLKDASSLTAWVYRIATNEALRVIERRKQESIPLDNVLLNASSMAADSYVDYTDIETVRLQQAILSLPEKQRLTFNLRYYDSLDYADIAVIIASTPAAAKANFHTAKDKIIKYMNSHD